MGILDKIFGKTSNAIPVLRAKIVFDDENNVSVDFEKLHPELPTFEYIKMALHLYAKMLVNLDPEDPNTIPASQLLITGVKNLTKAKLDQNSNILKLTNIDDVVKFSTPKGKTYTYLVTLYAISGLIRHVATEIPSEGTMQQGVFTVPVLIQGILRFLDNSEIEILKLSLRAMNKQYGEGISFSDLGTWENVPNKAFFSTFEPHNHESVDF